MWNRSLRNFSAAGVIVLLIAAVLNSAAAPVLMQAASGTAQPPPDQPLVYEERVLDLPEDAGVWHTTIVYPEKHPSDVASRRLAAALSSEARLRSLLAQTKTHTYATSDPLWRQRLQQHYGVTAPALIVQQPDGRVCYKASGNNLPGDARLLADQIATSLEQCRPRPTPTPQPTPAPLTPAVTIPDIGPTTPAALDGDSSLLWMVIVPILAGLGGLLQEWKQSNV